MPRSFYDEIATFDDEQPTSGHGRPDRTTITLDDLPEPTLPPHEPDELDARMRPTPEGGEAPGIDLASGTNPPPVRLQHQDRYEIEKLLGEGAFGRVFAARDTKLGRRVALKRLHQEYVSNAEIRGRFLQEAHAAACIAHPGIVTMFDVGDDYEPYIAMELLVGESLQGRVNRIGPLPPVKAREIGRQVASALDAAHRAGVLHRDLKPENILLVPDPAAVDGERVKVLDFGLAKPMLKASVKTRAATVFGTPLYMAPEQFEPIPNTNPRSDIYALGCVLFQLLTGRPPYDGTLREVVTHQRTSPVQSPRAVNPDVDAELDRIIQHMLQKDPKARPQTMAEVEILLRPTLRPPPDAPQPRRKRRTLRTALAVTIAFASCLAMLG